MTGIVHIELPASLCLLAGTGRTIALTVSEPITQRRVLDALEQLHPALRGTLRDQTSKMRRPFIRFFACQSDLSHEPPDAPLPPAIRDGTETLYIVGAIAGG